MSENAANATKRQSNFVTSASTSRRPPSRMGVRSFLFVVLSVCAILPVTFFGWNQAERIARDEVASSDRQTLAVAWAAANYLQQAMENCVHAAEGLAAQLATPGGLDQEAIRHALEAHVPHHPEFLGTYVADANGLSRLHMNNSGDVSEVPTDYTDRQYYRELIKTKRTTISKVTLGRFTRVLSVQVVAPIIDAGGQFLGYSCSSVDLSAIANKAQETVRGLQGGRVLIVDPDGLCIADSSAEAERQPKDVADVPINSWLGPGTAELRTGIDDRNQQARGAAVGLSPPVTGWRVMATLPQRQVDAQAEGMRRQVLWVIVGLIVGILALTAWIATLIAKPLRYLAATADAVAQGDLERDPWLNGWVPREMALLAIAMRSMIRNLRHHTHNLEAEVVARTKDLHTANLELEEALRLIGHNQQVLQADLSKARLFQEKMLPRQSVYGQFDVAMHHAPLEQVSGDIFDVCEISRQQVRVFIADATGHGVQAGMRTIILKSAYDRIKLHHSNPTTVLATLNKYLVEEFPDGDLHCTALCVDLLRSVNGVEVVYVNAGGPPLFVLSPDAPAEEHYIEGPLLGVDEVTMPEPKRLQLQRGQLILLASDGLTEQCNTQRQHFETELRQDPGLHQSDAAAALEAILERFDRFREGTSIRDDITAIVIMLG